MEYSVHAPGRSVIGSIVFLIISLPLGVVFFTVTVTGLALGLGTIVIWIGLPLLCLTLLCIRSMAAFERWSVHRLLGLPLHSRWPTLAPAQGFLRRFGAMLRDPYTWTSTLYMLVKLPLGILNFSLALTLVLLSTALSVLPLLYLVGLYVDLLLLAHGIEASSVFIPGTIEIHGVFDPLAFTRSLLGVPLGVLCWMVTCPVLRVLAICSGELARLLLGPGEAVAQPHQDRPYLAPLLVQERRAGRD